MPDKPIDWSKCDDVESVPGRVSGAWVIKETRVQADAVVERPRTDSRRNKFAIKAVLRYAKVTPPSKGREFCSTRIPRQRRGILTAPTCGLSARWAGRVIPMDNCECSDAFG
jgi:hypothetical protein